MLSQWTVLRKTSQCWIVIETGRDEETISDYIFVLSWHARRLVCTFDSPQKLSKVSFSTFLRHSLIYIWFPSWKKDVKEFERYIYLQRIFENSDERRLFYSNIVNVLKRALHIYTRKCGVTNLVIIIIGAN